jgi:FMN phosphatase YigB (HAD superfamily)
MVVLFDIGETLLDMDAQQAALALAHREVLADNGFPLNESE